MQSISLKQAFEINFSLPKPNLKITQINIYKSLGKILAQDIVCKKPLPAFDNSAMDGYALKLQDLNLNLKISDTILAGEDSFEKEVKSGECIKIMTGAMLPRNCDLVVPFEKVEVINKGFIKVKGSFQKGANIRYCGEEKNINDILVKKGTKLTPVWIGLIASQGIDTLDVYESLKIGIYSSGDEVIEPGNEAKNYQIYNINSIAIFSYLQCFETAYLGNIEDKKDLIEKALNEFEKYDVIITSGGVSKGEADFFEEVLLKNDAKIHYHGVRLKPGHPIMCASLNLNSKEIVIFALPGNPLSALINLVSMVIPTLEYFSGSKSYYPKPLYAKIKNSLSLKHGRSNIILGFYDKGEFLAWDKSFSSSALHIMSECNAYIIVDENMQELRKDENVKIFPYLMDFSDTIKEFIN